MPVRPPSVVETTRFMGTRWPFARPCLGSTTRWVQGASSAVNATRLSSPQGPLLEETSPPIVNSIGPLIVNCPFFQVNLHIFVALARPTQDRAQRVPTPPPPGGPTGTVRATRQAGLDKPSADYRMQPPEDPEAGRSVR